MKTDLILALYFLLIAIIALLLTPTYLPAVFELEKIIRNRTSGNCLSKLYSMPQKSENLPPNGADIDDECQHIPLNCPRTITSENKTLSVVITCLKWTFDYDFWIRVTAHPEGNPNIPKQIDISKQNPLLVSLSEALTITQIFLNPARIPINFIFLENYKTAYFDDITPTMANTHLAYPNPAIDKFSGTDSDEDSESFIQLIERKINFALRDGPADAGELVNYTFRKKPLFSSLLRVPFAEWSESNITNATTWEMVRTIFITRFSCPFLMLDRYVHFRHLGIWMFFYACLWKSVK